MSDAHADPTPDAVVPSPEGGRSPGGTSDTSASKILRN